VVGLLESGLVTKGTLTRLGLKLTPSAPSSTLPQHVAPPAANPGRNPAALSPKQLAAQLPPGTKLGHFRTEPPKEAPSAPKKRELTAEQQEVRERIQAPAGLPVLKEDEDPSKVNECALGGKAEDLRLAVLSRPDGSLVFMVVSKAKSKVILDLVNGELREKRYAFSFCSPISEHFTVLKKYLSEVSALKWKELQSAKEAVYDDLDELKEQHDFDHMNLLRSKLVLVKHVMNVAAKAFAKQGGNSHSPAPAGQRPGGKPKGKGHKGGAPRHDDRDDEE